MANRRMFSLDVVDTDRFLDMSASAQALYFHLGMRADDDGFVSSPRKIAKASNCGLDDLTLLAAKGFIIPFESGVVVVTHWKENNYIRADRYKPTRYTKEAEMLEKIGDVYQLSTTGIPTDNQMVDTSDIHYQSRANEVGAISKAIKALAMELNIPIIALSQLNRVSEMRQDKVPTMGELREAGDIEQDASIILLMWNIVDDKKGLKVEKNRQGILSTEVLRFDGDNMQFIETDESIKEAAKGFRKAEEPTPFD